MQTDTISNVMADASVKFLNKPIEIPNKSTFKINEVCALTGIKSYVLRFWESEFDEISPIPSSSGQKLYELKDIEAILLIKKLLFEDKLTIERARVEIKKLIPEIKLIDTVYEKTESSLKEDSVDSFFLDQEDQAQMNYSNKYDVKKLDPEVIQTLKDKFKTSTESTLEELENSSQAINEAGHADKEEIQAVSVSTSATSLTIRTLSDQEFKKLVVAKAKLKEMLNFLENEVSAQ